MTSDLPFPFDQPTTPPSDPLRPRRLLAIFLAFIFLISLGLLIRQQTLLAGRIASEREHRNNLHNITLALGNYFDQFHGSSPYASINDSKGHPLYSWRIAMCPWIDGQVMYSVPPVPWNDPRMIVRMATAVDDYDHGYVVLGPNAHFQSATVQSIAHGHFLYCFDPDPKTGYHSTASILAITGPDSPIPDTESARNHPPWNLNGPLILPKPLGNLILFMEVFNSGVHWMEPVDLVVRDNQLTLRDKPFEIKVPDTARGFHVAFHDKVWLLDKKTPVEVLIPLMKLSTAGHYDRETHLAPYILEKSPPR